MAESDAKIPIVGDNKPNPDSKIKVKIVTVKNKRNFPLMFKGVNDYYHIDPYAMVDVFHEDTLSQQFKDISDDLIIINKGGK